MYLNMIGNIEAGFKPREELQELELAVKGNEDAIKTNEAVIQALLAALS